MTDTEAKAHQLEMECAKDMGITSRAIRRDTFSTHEALCRAIEREEATEARHAAELRELKERFSEAAEKALYQMRANQLLQASVQPTLAPFIIAKPDPLVEVCRWIGLAPYRPDELRAAIEKRGGKIVWEAGE